LSMKTPDADAAMLPRIVTIRLVLIITP